MGKTYVTDYGKFRDEFGSYVGKSKRLPTHIEREGYFFTDLKSGEDLYEQYLLEKSKNEKNNTTKG